MGTSSDQNGRLRTRWAAIGAAVAVTLGTGGIGFVSASVSSGERSVLIPITSCRVIDIRPDFQVGPKASPLGPNETLTVSAHGDNGNCTGIPNDAVALSLNVTALDASAPTFLTIWADGISRPVASSLNPSPGAPPTPNAVTTELSPGGQFNVFNRAGSVNVFIDVTGYYVDHDHDDRYDTTATVNSKVAAATADADAKIAAQAALGPTVIDFSMLDMAPFEDGTGWSRSLFYAHTGGSNECLTFPFDAVPGQVATGARLTYVNQSAATIDVQVQILGLKTTPGPIPGGLNDLIHRPIDETQTLPIPAGGSEIPAMTVGPGADPTLREGFRYAGVACTADDIVVIGARVTLANP